MVLSSLQFVRRKGDPRVYVKWISDQERMAGYSPISAEELNKLGVTDKNVLYVGKVDDGLIGTPVASDTLQAWAQDTVTNYDPRSTPIEVVKTGVIPALASGQKVPLPVYDINIDPTTPEEEVKNQSIAAQMKSQAAAQAELEIKTPQPTGQVLTGQAQQEYLKTSPWTVSQSGEVIDANHPLVKQYLQTFPNANLDVAIGSVVLQQQAKTKDETPIAPIGNLPAAKYGVSPITGQPYAAGDLNMPNTAISGSENAAVATEPTEGSQNGITTPSVSPVGAGEPTMDTTAQVSTDYSQMPANITSLDSWKNLTEDQKRIAYFQYQTQIAQNEAQKKDAEAALNQAISLADPYYKEQLRMVKDEISRAAVSTSAGFSEQQKTLEDRIGQIKEDLVYNKEQLSIEERADLAAQLRKNEQDLLSLKQNAAESGLVFSSPRKIAEQQLLTEQKDINESTRRKYAQAIREQEVAASRNLLAQQRAGETLARTTQEKLTDIQRTGESKIGTTEAPVITGVEPLGGITGQLTEDKQQKIISLQEILEQRQNPFKFS